MFEKLIDEYKQSHRHPINKALHALGIPLIVVSLPWFFFQWRTAVVLFVCGWALQFIGHAFEGKPPVFLKEPRALLIAPIWWIRKLLGKE